MDAIPVRRLFGVPFHDLTWEDALGLAEEWTNGDAPRQISVVNAHSVAVARRDPDFLRAIEASDLVLPDSVPLVWISRLLGRPLRQRLAGPDYCESVCRWAERRGRSVFFLGSTPEVLERIRARLREKFPGLNVAGVHSPPYRAEFTFEDSEEMLRAVARARPDILWVGLTAPKQEKWIRRFRPRLECKMAVGIGAAFDFLAGTRRRAPAWVQAMGCEWLYRFLQEPRRLWRRYVLSNGEILALTVVELVRVRLFGRREK